MLVYGSDPHRALTLIDSALIVGNINDFTASFLRAKVYANTLVDGRPDEAIGICVQLLQHDSTQAVTASRADKRSDILQVLMDAYRVKEDDEQWLRYAIERAQLCQAWGQETEALRIEADIALILNRLGRSEEGFAMMDKVMAALDAGAPSIDRMDAGIVARKRRIHMLEEQGQYADIPSLAQQILDKIADYQKRPSAYAEDSYRLPPGAEPREWYCQFCQSQAWGFMARAYAKMTPVDLDRVRKYTTLFEQSDYGKRLGGRKLITPAWKVLGQWDKVLAVDDEVEGRLGGDTLNTDFAAVLMDRAQAASAQGQPELAMEWMKRHSELQEKLHRQQQESEAHEYAAKYRAQQQEKRIQEAQTLSARRIVMFWAAFAMFALALVFAFFAVRWSRRTVEDKAPAAPSLVDPELFDTIQRTILEERLYAQASLQRQDILDRFHISRRTLNELLSTYAQGRSFPVYINDIRIQEALKLLDEHPEMTLTEIAGTVGLTLPNFREQFKQRYGQTPTEYRQTLRD